MLRLSQSCRYKFSGVLQETLRSGSFSVLGRVPPNQSLSIFSSRKLGFLNVGGCTRSRSGMCIGCGCSLLSRNAGRSQNIPTQFEKVQFTGAHSIYRNSCGGATQKSGNPTCGTDSYLKRGGRKSGSGCREIFCTYSNSGGRSAITRLTTNRKYASRSASGIVSQVIGVLTAGQSSTRITTGT